LIVAIVATALAVVTTVAYRAVRRVRLRFDPRALCVPCQAVLDEGPPARKPVGDERPARKHLPDDDTRQASWCRRLQC
jgi:hypothetical protein